MIPYPYLLQNSTLKYFSDKRTVDNANKFTAFIYVEALASIGIFPLVD
jgi:hypothetical protein